MDPIRTVPDLLRQVATYSNPKAFNYHHEGKWHALSTEEFLRQVRGVTLALKSYGVKKGDRVGIVSAPSPFWTIADCAIMASGAVCVPLFANISPENFEFEISQADVRIAFVSGEEPWKMISHNKKHFDTLISMDPHEHVNGAIDWNEALEHGKAWGKNNPSLYESLLNEADPNALASIVYTSGSTGVPKGVQLSQHNLLCMIHPEAFYWNHETDRYLNVLPLAHIFGRTLNFILFGWGMSVYYFNDLKNMGPICKEVKPTILVVVPRLLEKVYAKMLSNVEHASGLKRTIGKWAFNLTQKSGDSWYKQLLYPLADKLVYRALRDALGGKIRVAITGGAAMNPELQRFFLEVGIPIYEGWGMTEGCPGCVNRPGRNKVGAIGPPLPGVDIKISHQGEILMRGPIITKDYYKNPEATAQLIDEEGWLHTGDKGVIDEEGYVKIVGRIKEMFKTSTGEYVVPGPIEQQLCEAPLIEWALVVADKRKYASVLLFPAFEIVARLKKEQGVKEMSDADFLQSDFVKQEMEKLISQINANLNNWEQLRAYYFVPHVLTIEAGEITPSMKMRRKIVEQKFSSEIEQMYPGEAKYERASSDH